MKLGENRGLPAQFPSPLRQLFQIHACKRKRGLHFHPRSPIGDFSAFKRPKQLFAYFGLDPIVKQSGSFAGCDLKMSKRGSPYARRCIYVLAIQSISLRVDGTSKNPVLRSYYDEKCKTKSKMTALGAIMHKVCNIIYAVLRDEKPFVLITPEEHKAAYLAA